MDRDTEDKALDILTTVWMVAVGLYIFAALAFMALVFLAAVLSMAS